MKKLFTAVCCTLLLLACNSQKSAGSKTEAANGTGFKTLVFSKTAGYRHKSIPAGQQAIFDLGKKHGFEVDTTEDASFFNDEKLKGYAVVVFLSTTLDVLNDKQQVAFEKYIQSGGGFVGIHAAADTEYDWPWYGKLVGGYFKSHPPGVHEATIHVVDKNHASTSMLPDDWVRTDEWYNFKDLNPETHVLCHLDESTYEGGENGDPHPIAWYHEYDGGRAFYTASGHTSESFGEPLFREHIWGGIRWVAGR